MTFEVIKTKTIHRTSKAKKILELENAVNSIRYVEQELSLLKAKMGNAKKDRSITERLNISHSSIITVLRDLKSRLNKLKNSTPSKLTVISNENIKERTNENKS